MAAWWFRDSFSSLMFLSLVGWRSPFWGWLFDFGATSFGCWVFLELYRNCPAFRWFTVRDFFPFIWGKNFPPSRISCFALAWFFHCWDLQVLLLVMKLISFIFSPVSVWTGWFSWKVDSCFRCLFFTVRIICREALILDVIFISSGRS